MKPRTHELMRGTQPEKDHFGFTAYVLNQKPEEG